MRWREKRKADAGGHRLSGAISGMRALYGKPEATGRASGWQPPTMPKNWRDRLPDPLVYYASQIGKLTRPNGGGWAQGKCPFHEDKAASLSVNAGGGWKCFAGCGKGDLVGFHQRRTGLAFAEAVRDLLGVRS